MQTYEIAPGESLDYVAQAMRLLAQEDPEMLIRVPLNADPIDGPYAAERLHSALLGVTTRVLVQAADPQTVAWLLAAGFEAEPLLGTMPPPAPPPVPPAEAAPAVAEEGAAAGAPGWSPRVAWTPSGPPAAPAPPPPPAPEPPAEKQGFLQKLWNAVAPPAPPPPAPAPAEPFAAAMAVPSEPPAPPPVAPPLAPEPPLPEPEGPPTEPEGEGPAGLDVMLPVLHEETATEAPVPPRRRPITSPLDATMEPIADTGRMAAAAPPMPDAGAAAPAQDTSAAPGGDLAGLGGSAQSAATIGAAVQAAGLDARTRALLLFGMALVRLATAEAAGAAMAARQAGCSDSELALVVEMAHALGGGPSERLGHKILGM